MGLLVRKSAKGAKGIIGVRMGCRCMDAGHEETRWPARVSHAPLTGGGGPELKDGAAKQGTVAKESCCSTAGMHT